MTIQKLTSQLEPGDIVDVHGMRVLLRPNPYEYERGDDAQHGKVRSFAGEVLNRDEITGAFLHHHTAPRDDRDFDNWTIQGNDLVRWEVETEPTQYCTACGVGPFFYVAGRDDPKLCIECGPSETGTDRMHA